MADEVKKIKPDKSPERFISVRYHGCSNKYQDQMYGVGRRLFNRTKQNKPKEERQWRCTNCGKEED